MLKLDSETWRRRFAVTMAWFVLSTSAASFADADAPEVIRLRAYGVPSEFGGGVVYEAERAIFDTFRRKFPLIDPVSTVGLTLPGSRSMDMVPFMQIAGDIAPDVMYVNFRQSDTYIRMKLLYPLDQYVEAEAGARIADSSTLDNEQYLDQLRAAPDWPVIEQRVPQLAWPVMRRECPYGRDCPHVRRWGYDPQPRHRHVWAYPCGPAVMGLQFKRTLLAEHGLQQRAPRDWEELLSWAKIVHDPARRQYGMSLMVETPGWEFLSFLYSAGGRVVEEQSDGSWKCMLDSEAAVEAALFFARLRFERFEKNGRTYEGVLASSSESAGGEIEFGFDFTYLDGRFLKEAENRTTGFGPVPRGPTGLRGSEFNSRMMGIFAGLAEDDPRRQAAWEYMRFFDGPEARRIHTERMVQAGLGEFVRPELLRQFNTDGRFDDVLRKIPADLEETYRQAMEAGVPEPYGKNCQYVYDQMNKPLGEILGRESVRRAVQRGDFSAAKDEIRQILQRGTQRINQHMLGNLPEPVRQRRNIVAWVVIALVLAIFAVVMRRVLLAFRPPRQEMSDAWQFGRYRWAYLMMAPAILTIALWMYWPLAKGSVIAFQDYSVMGDSRFIGAANFAEVLFDAEMWNSLKISLIYALLFLIFGFWAPIALAFLLQEVPRGNALFRTIYYLPAILSGVVVIFLWKSFYSPDGMINEVLNGGVYAINAIFNARLEPFTNNWLESPKMALFFCLLPTIWAGMGPGCLIYLAALKTIPEEHYEAADIDGAGIWRKVFSIALPGIKTLVSINFIGAMIGAIRGAGGFVLAMTGGGPFGEGGGATEVIGLKLFYTTFGYLKFGAGAAMAWVLGAMLIGFTVLQLQRLSKMEFKTAAATGK